MDLEFVMNSVDPRLPNRDLVDKVKTIGDESPYDAITRLRQMCAQFVIGLPRATEAHTQHALEDMGMVGLYRSNKGAVQDIEQEVEA